MSTDPYLVVYTISGIILVMLAYIVLSFFSDGVRTIHDHFEEKEKKRKEEEKKRRAA